MFPNYYASLFSTTEIGNATYGTLNSFQVFLESAMMGVVPIIMKKIGVRNSLLLGATVMFLRIGLCGVFHDPVSVSIVKLFHSIEVPLFCLPAFRYFTLALRHQAVGNPVHGGLPDRFPDRPGDLLHPDGRPA